MYLCNVEVSALDVDTGKSTKSKIEFSYNSGQKSIQDERKLFSKVLKTAICNAELVRQV